MRLIRQYDSAIFIFYNNNQWYSYAEYKPLYPGSNIIRRYNNNLTTYGYFENGSTKKFYIL